MCIINETRTFSLTLVSGPFERSSLTPACAIGTIDSQSGLYTFIREYMATFSPKIICAGPCGSQGAGEACNNYTEADPTEDA